MAKFSQAIQEQIDGRTVRVAALVEFIFANVTHRFWTGVGDLEAMGESWRSFSAVITLPVLEQMTSGQADRISLTLSGVSDQMLQLALDDYENGDVIGAREIIYLQFFDEDWQPLDDAIVRFKGQLDGFKYTETSTDDGFLATLAVFASNLFALRSSPAHGFYTDADQQARHAGDRFNERIPSLADASLTWPDF